MDKFYTVKIAKNVRKTKKLQRKIRENEREIGSLKIKIAIRASNGKGEVKNSEYIGKMQQRIQQLQANIHGKWQNIETIIERSYYLAARNGNFTLRNTRMPSSDAATPNKQQRTAKRKLSIGATASVIGNKHNRQNKILQISFKSA